MQFLRQTTSITIRIGPFVDEDNGKTAETGLTISQADIRVSKNGGDFAQSNHTGGATHDEFGWYYLTLDTTDTGTLGRLTIAIHESGALPVWREFLVVKANYYDTLFSTAYLNVNTVEIESADATDKIRDAVVDDATRIDASDLNTLSGKAPSKAYLAGSTDADGGIDTTEQAVIQAECTDALDAYDPPTKGEQDSAFTEIKGATWAAGTDTLEKLEEAIVAANNDVKDLQAEVGTDGAGLTDLGGMSTGMQAEVEAEVDDSLATFFTSAAQLVDDVWNEELTAVAHNVAASSGRRLRAIQDYSDYAEGAVWIDTVNGVAGTTNFENGTVSNPVDTIADALNLASSIGLTRLRVLPGSSITFADTMNGYDIGGSSWTLALGSQSCSGTIISGATVSGICTGATAPEFYNCKIGTVTVPASRFISCQFTGTVSLSAAGDYFWDGCFSGVAGTGTPGVDFGAAVVNTNLSMRHYSGGIEVKNIGKAGTDNMSLEGFGQLVLNANCAGGTIAIRGNFTVTDNAGGAVTLSDGARIDGNKVADHVIRRSFQNACDSADGDTKTGRSLLGAVAKLVNKIAQSGSTLSIYEDDDTTALFTQEVTTASGADPITELDTT